ncbi:MAG: hypothetical protein M3Z84_06085, partial [Actinomycetota bacterium]|nr:hypothetical protein [Actinomycetota bacterium]
MSGEPGSHRDDAEPAGSRGARFERIEDSLIDGIRGVERSLKPAWRRLTQGEPRWPVSLAVVAALVMQATLPDHLVLGTRWLLPGLGAVLLVALVAANPGRIDKTSKLLRAGALALIATISLANAGSAGRLITGLVNGTEHAAASDLLITGGAIWLTNVIVFSLWYWEFDRGGPVARVLAIREFPDFLFPQ